jgi:hypothetical protein
VRIWRKVDKKDKTEDRLAEALMVSEEAFLKQYDDIGNLTKKIRFKANRLNEGKNFLFLLHLCRLIILSACALFIILRWA